MENKVETLSKLKYPWSVIGYPRIAQIAIHSKPYPLLP